jgi:membrane-bound lytic murein transglycosylase F
MKSDYSSFGDVEKLSPYDDLIKEGANALGWDWRLFAAMIYQESKFGTHEESWSGAKGLMQLMPQTAKRFGAYDLEDPVQNIHAGVKYLKYLNRYWSKKIKYKDELLNFIMASYNDGLTHIIDASRHAEKYGKDPAVWTDNVEYYLLKKSDVKFYRDAVVKAGYCKCEEPVNYVKDVQERYEQYKEHIAV